MKTLPLIVISTLAHAARDASAIQATKVLSIIDPEDQAPLVPGTADHVVLRYHDIDSLASSSDRAPSSEQIAQIIVFAASLTSEDRCLVHCHAGISRSPAAVFIMLAALTGSAARAVAAMRTIEPNASYDPNPLMLELADRQLGLDGSLAAAIDLIRPGSVCLAADQIW